MLQKYLTRALYKELGYLPRRRPFVFGIGLSRTGTTTLNDALRILGHRAYHLPPITRVEPGTGSIRLDWPWWMSRFDAATDMTVAVLFRELDATFPNARFVYTRRDRADWLDSCRRHFTEDLYRRKQALGHRHIIDVTRAFYGTPVFDEAAFAAAYDRHEAAVLAHFRGRRRFLDWALVESPGWQPLCRFLGRPAPAEPFPFSNRGRPQAQAVAGAAG